MLQVKPYCGMPLCVHILDPATYLETLPSLQCVQNLPAHITVHHGDFDHLENACAVLMAVGRDLMVASPCRACAELFKGGDRVVWCPSCKEPFHPSCAAQIFLDGRSLTLMPTGAATCPSCQGQMFWAQLVRSGRRLQSAPLQVTDGHRASWAFADTQPDASPRECSPQNLHDHVHAINSDSDGDYMANGNTPSAPSAPCGGGSIVETPDALMGSRALANLLASAPAELETPEVFEAQSSRTGEVDGESMLRERLPLRERLKRRGDASALAI